MTLDRFVTYLSGVKRTSRGVMARCPAHEDRSPSLSIRESERGLLLHDFAGCTTDAIVQALGLKLSDLFFDAPTPRGQQPPPPRPAKVDRVAVAWRFELAALDRRLRAERVLTAAQDLDGDRLTNPPRDRLMDAVARAYQDMEGPEVFELVADTLRDRAFDERP